MSGQTDPARRAHILTVELEDYFQVGALSGTFSPDHWHRFDSRAERNTTATLDLLDEAGAKATFFILGWTAYKFPELVSEVARRGHEVACKGFYHRPLHQLSREEFRADVQRSRDSVERAAGVEVRGYRLTCGRLSEKDLWALEVLAEEGFVYDSSVRPLGWQFPGEKHRRFIHEHKFGERSIVEVPSSTLCIGPMCLPISGGNYMRQLPGFLTRRAILRWDQTVAAPLVFYFHVWDLDADQPRINAAPLLQRIRLYRNFDKMSMRLRYYLDHFRFVSIAESLELPAPAAVSRKLPAARQESSAPARLAPREKIAIIVPCYNEEEALPYLANTLRRFADEISDRYELSFVFVDDGSRDRTWEMLNDLFGDWANCRLVRHEGNKGITAATLTGLSNASCEIVCAMDCDCTYDPNQFLTMVPMMTGDVAMVTASPYHRLGHVHNVPHWRLFLSRSLSLLYRCVLHNKLATYTSCFRVYRRSAVIDVAPRYGGFFGIAEILAIMDLRGMTIRECPAVLEVRLFGWSKMSIWRAIAGHLKLLAELAAKRWLGVNHNFGNQQERKRTW